MSRIGKKPIAIPENIEVQIDGRNITVKGPKGELDFSHHPNIAITKKDNIITLQPLSTDKLTKSVYGLNRNLVANMITGVSEGFQKQLELKGIGYRAALEATNLVLYVGYTHPVTITPLPGIEFKVEKNTIITVSGIDKQKVGQTAAEIRKVRPPEPYKGKGIKYLGEIVRRKAGKATKTSG
ncbi:MAG: 50S ribosomal protein L6 [bacterium]|nr:50S ribosomal protein L6 [bacterium]